MTVAVLRDCGRCFAAVLGPLVKTDRVDAVIRAHDWSRESLEATALIGAALGVAGSGAFTVALWRQARLSGRCRARSRAKAALRQLRSSRGREVRVINRDLLPDVVTSTRLRRERVLWF